MPTPSKLDRPRKTELPDVANALHVKAIAASRVEVGKPSDSGEIVFAFGNRGQANLTAKQ
jgi:hypothetical protein